MKKVKLDDLANICPDCKFKTSEDMRIFQTLIKSELKNAKRDGYYTATAPVIPEWIELDREVFITEEDYEKYFKSLNKAAE